MNELHRSLRGVSSGSDRIVEQPPLFWFAVWRARWFVLAGAIAVAALVFALLPSAPPASVWTAKSLVRIGSMPRLAVFGSAGGELIQPVEDVQETIARLTAPTFRAMIAREASFERATRDASSALFGGSLTGTPVNSRTLWITASAASEADAVSALTATIAHLRQIHDGMTKQRMAILDAPTAGDHALLVMGDARLASEPTEIVIDTGIDVAKDVTSPRSMGKMVAAAGLVFAAVALIAAAWRRRA